MTTLLNAVYLKNDQIFNRLDDGTSGLLKTIQNGDTAILSRLTAIDTNIVTLLNANKTTLQTAIDTKTTTINTSVSTNETDIKLKQNLLTTDITNNSLNMKTVVNWNITTQLNAIKAVMDTHDTSLNATVPLIHTKVDSLYTKISVNTTSGI